MEDYRHHVSGFFPRREPAERARARIIELGLPQERLKLLDAASAAPSAPSSRESAADSKAVLKDMVVDGAIGSAVGAGVGALAQVALVAANVSLFVASPLIAPLAMLGWGASLGGFVGAAVGAGNAEKPFSALIDDAIASGQVVVVAETRTEDETRRVCQVIEAAVGECSDVVDAA